MRFYTGCLCLRRLRTFSGIDPPLFQFKRDGFRFIFMTGRNEGRNQGNVFTSVCLSKGGGCLQFFEGGVSKLFWGGASPNFFFLFKFFSPKFLLGYTNNPAETVNARPVRILLECIFILFFFFCNFIVLISLIRTDRHGWRIERITQSDVS